MRRTRLSSAQRRHRQQQLQGAAIISLTAGILAGLLAVAGAGIVACMAPIAIGALIILHFWEA